MRCLKLDIPSLSSLKQPNRDTDEVCGLAVSVGFFSLLSPKVVFWDKVI